MDLTAVRDDGVAVALAAPYAIVYTSLQRGNRCKYILKVGQQLYRCDP